MNKKLLTMLALSTTALRLYSWQETRTPLSLYQGYMHYQLDRDRDPNHYNLDTHFWTGLYFRSATEAYRNQDCDVGCSKLGSTESLAALYFGQSTFTLE